MHAWGWGSGMGWGFGGGIISLLVIAIVIAGIIFLVRWLAQQSGDSASHHSQVFGKNAKDILDERYARGEISRDEYHEMKSEIKK
ncbi:MAG: SHOCT domain-containing protein [Spirochaetales bacterium]|nr:SHOCT domain-containing protein [Spirochaetales bacterium]MCF7939854.1 SHOCT domain-containing protein [Spirochaetales bacterium]